MKDHALDKAIVISIVIHAIILAVVLVNQIKLFKKDKAHRRVVEISYREIKKNVTVSDRPIKPVQQLDLSQQSLMDVSKQMPVPLTKSKGQLPAGLMVDNKPERWRSLSTQRRKIVITPIASPKINNPAYAAYNEMVRSRIEEKVYANVDKVEPGRVYLTFVVGHDGRLKAYQVIDERTDGSMHLKEISLDSLSQASPFPPFLKGMTLPEYTFNIEIQYQMGE